MTDPIVIHHFNRPLLKLALIFKKIFILKQSPIGIEPSPLPPSRIGK